MDDRLLENKKFISIFNDEYFTSYIDYFNEDKVVVGLGCDYDLTQHIESDEIIDHQHKDPLEKVLSIAKGDYIGWTIRRIIEVNGEILLQVNKILGRVENGLKDIYEFKKDVGHVIPIKALDKKTVVLKYYNVINWNKIENINSGYDEFKDLDYFKELEYEERNKFYMNIKFFSEEFIKIGDKEIIIDLSNLKVTDKPYLYAIKNFSVGDFLLGQFIYAGEDTKVLRAIGKIKKIDLKNDTKITLEVISKEEKKYEYGSIISIHNNDINSINNFINKDKNIILYGPPGTGKTYNIDNEVLKIIDYSKYINNMDNRKIIHSEVKKAQLNNQVRFCTFHQSYGYEEFIEGLRSDGKGNFILEDGILKEIAIEAMFEGLLYYLKSDLVSKMNSMNENEIKSKKKELVLEYINDSSKYDFFDCDQYVIVIDEINRGNISKIFGELLTLLEEDKRLDTENEVIVKLPYSKEEFSLPPNLHLIGTMNSSDKSVAPIDIALRRRFKFKEIMPDEEILNVVDDIDLCKMLNKINSRIEYLYDRDYMIGHAYFITCTSQEDIINTINGKIIPLLQEYFYEDWKNIALVLGGIGKSEADKYIVYREEINPKDLFDGTYIDEFTTSYKYNIKSNITEKELKSIYE